MASNLPQTRPPRRATSRCLAGGMPVYRHVCVKVKTLSTFSGANSRRQRSILPRVPCHGDLPQDPSGQHPRHSDPPGYTATLVIPYEYPHDDIPTRFTKSTDSTHHIPNIRSLPTFGQDATPISRQKHKRPPTVPRSPETQQKTTLATEPSTAPEAVQSPTTAP